MKKVIIFLMLLGFLVGCQQGKLCKEKREVYLQESIARLSDIPDAPLHVKVCNIIKSEQIPDNLQVFYRFQNVNKDTIKDFYIEEMERFGWRLHFYVDAEQDIIEFIKPNGMICLLILKHRELIVTLIKKKEML